MCFLGTTAGILEIFAVAVAGIRCVLRLVLALFWYCGGKVLSWFL